MYARSVSRNGKRLIVALPEPDGSDPIPRQYVDEINRFNQGSAGSGDVYIAHAVITPTDDKIHLSQYPSSWAGDSYRSFFGFDDGGSTKTKVRYYGPGIWYQFTDFRQSSTPLGITAEVTKFSRWSKGKARYASGSVNIRYSRTQAPELDDLIQFLPDALSKAEELCDSKLRSYNDAIQSTISVWIESGEYVPSCYSQLESYLESRELGLQSFHRSGLDNAKFYKAYYKAVEGLPTLRQNTLMNIVECLATIVSFLDGFDSSDLTRGGKTLKDLWLRYRYQFRTTISDMEEVTNALQRLNQVAGKKIRTYGYVSDGGVAYYCCIVCSLPIPDNISDFCYQTNARLTLENVWDMIPYSFVVDWFTGIGSILGDLQIWLDDIHLDIDDVWYSVIKKSNEPGKLLTEYGRWRGNPPALPYFTVIEEGLFSRARTLLLRAFDVIALII